MSKENFRLRAAQRLMLRSQINPFQQSITAIEPTGQFIWVRLFYDDLEKY